MYSSAFSDAKQVAWNSLVPAVKCEAQQSTLRKQPLTWTAPPLIERAMSYQLLKCTPLSRGLISPLPLQTGGRKEQ